MSPEEKRRGPATGRLAEQQCKPCKGGVEPIRGQRLAELKGQIEAQWQVSDDERQITRTFKFPDFESALDFVDEVGELAEQEGHHPDIHLSYGKVRIDLSTHAIDGLSDNDFILAAKIDEMWSDFDLE